MTESHIRVKRRPLDARRSDRTAARRPALRLASSPSAGKTPRQARSRERVARIVAASLKLVRSSGIRGLKMSAVAKSAGIPIGSLYQYFPSSSQLIHRLFLETLQGLHGPLLRAGQAADSPSGFARALSRLIHEVHEITRADPLLREIWGGMQADREIRNLLVKDNEFYSGLLAGMAQRSGSKLTGEALRCRATVINEMLDSVLRLAITRGPARSARLLQDAIAVAVREFEL